MAKTPEKQEIFENWAYFSRKILQNLIFLMYMIHLSSILVYLCIDITQINFRQFFQRILLNMFKRTIIQQEMLKITVLIKQRKCFLIVQLEILDLLFGIL